MKEAENVPSWIRGLEDEDLNLLHRFLLASGSLKSLAREYGVSYPTVRLRLDRLIQKVRLLDDSEPQSPFHQKIRMLVLEGKMDRDVAKTVIREFESSKREESS